MKNVFNKRAIRACALSAAMMMMGVGAHAASFDLGTVSSSATLFTATPTLPLLTNDNRAFRSVAIDDTYDFALTTQSALSAKLMSTSAAGMGGVLTWSLNYALLDAQSNVLATGVLNPVPSISKGGQCQVVQGQQVNCTDTFSTYTINLADSDLQAGLYKLRITGTETAQNYGGLDRAYSGLVSATAVPEPGTALSLALGLLGLGCVTRRKVAKAA